MKFRIRIKSAMLGYSQQVGCYFRAPEEGVCRRKQDAHIYHELPRGFDKRRHVLELVL